MYGEIRFEPKKNEILGPAYSEVKKMIKSLEYVNIEIDSYISLINENTRLKDENIKLRQLNPVLDDKKIIIQPEKKSKPQKGWLTITDFIKKYNCTCSRMTFSYAIKTGKIKRKYNEDDNRGYLINEEDAKNYFINNSKKKKLSENDKEIILPVDKDSWITITDFIEKYACKNIPKSAFNYAIEKGKIKFKEHGCLMNEEDAITYFETNKKEKRRKK